MSHLNSAKLSDFIIMKGFECLFRFQNPTLTSYANWCHLLRCKVIIIYYMCILVYGRRTKFCCKYSLKRLCDGSSIVRKFRTFFHLNDDSSNFSNFRPGTVLFLKFVWRIYHTSVKWQGPFKYYINTYFFKFYSNNHNKEVGVVIQT